jgi:hypothetical protein
MHDADLGVCERFIEAGVGARKPERGGDGLSLGFVLARDAADFDADTPERLDVDRAYEAAAHDTGFGSYMYVHVALRSGQPSV